MKNQIHYFLTAVLFFTRIPCPKWVNHSPDILNKSSRYFSLVGILIGAISGLIYVGASFLFNPNIALVFSLIASVWTTGAFHEDGFADVCDGFGGGWTKDKILTIMKDSRLGTYGVVGIICLLSIKLLSLHQLLQFNNSIKTIPLVLISGHAISRFIATILLYTHQYVRDINTAKVKPTTKKMSTKALIISGFFGIFPLVFFQDIRVFTVLIPLFLTYLYMGRFFKKWIGGQTGDCAGALQQVSEVIFYLSILILWKLF
ncbi:adenosylcobinamide-GDP ribazoletransferase [Tenacibaculum finnmarkense]|uniref:adenosylcobinamide-GDP ribazoletransferase n=1 Tax=Tenacibaculum finnmarkense TaxID=2781243 RepID=UPI00187B30DE|nr:adenosylcobinamide-GDP ribazoletransferase [Tenacibaculum finnmarkense]MBE7634000.1 adenosylcobinamide-GDP ribazoletransferase [Tenacibaculum finnmarkense genomovar ulcerans]MCD8429757.1 adenosylcobinamide-GDP ribazoletransferase [Tenacibaculum finnmarkense genomovar ulcerans]MCG8812253.1 adenosylcobinamide-GDP ribazoletransferase [Tenacibaculum finnmarkense]